jgi:hypothetical protein
LISIKGILYKSIIKDLSNLTIFVTYPKLNLNCYLKKSSNYIQSNMKCFTKKKINKEILIENQIIHNQKNEVQLLILNKITLLQNYKILGNVNANDNKKSYLQNIYEIITNFVFKNLCCVAFVVFVFFEFDIKIALKYKKILYLKKY